MSRVIRNTIDIIPTNTTFTTQLKKTAVLVVSPFLGVCLWEWSKTDYKQWSHNVGEMTNNSLNYCSMFWTTWEEFTELTINQIYDRLGEVR